jgi:hypothetical protein
MNAGPVTRILSCAFLVIATPGHGAAAQSGDVPAEIASLLTGVGGFGSADLASLQSGRVITRTEEAPELLEGSVVTAVKIATTKERALDYFRLLVSYVDGQVTLAYGTFSRPPVEADLARLDLDTTDLSDLRACRPGACEITIGAATPADMSRALDWTAVDSGARASAWARRELASYVADYVRHGDAALVGRDDRGGPLDMREQWRSLFDRSQALAVVAPELDRYLRAFPAGRPAEAAEEFSFDRQRYTGLKPVIGVTHQVTWREPARADRFVMVLKQVAASHYFYGALAVTLILQDPLAAVPTTYVVYFNRLRGDLLRTAQPSNRGGLRARISGLGASIQRRVGEELIRQSAERLLGAMKQSLERQ